MNSQQNHKFCTSIWVSYQAFDGMLQQGSESELLCDEVNNVLTGLREGDSCFSCRIARYRIAQCTMPTAGASKALSVNGHSSSMPHQRA